MSFASSFRSCSASSALSSSPPRQGGNSNFLHSALELLRSRILNAADAQQLAALIDASGHAAVEATRVEICLYLEKIGELALLEITPQQPLAGWLLYRLVAGDPPHPALKAAGAGLTEALHRDLASLQALAGLPFGSVEAAPAMDRVVGVDDLLSVPAPWGCSGLRRQLMVDIAGLEDWTRGAARVTEFVASYGAGSEQGCVAYRFTDNGLLPISEVAAFPMEWLKGNEARMEALAENTRNFLRGYRAQNALVWGPRGCGKSTLIRALLTRHYLEGLRAIEIPASSYGRLRDLYDLVRHRGECFVGVLDNISMTSHDRGYRELSTVLEGGLERLPDNLVFYGTSNLKDLVDRGGERPIGPPLGQPGEAPAMAGGQLSYDPQQFQRLDERRALDDRFALKVFLDLPSKEDYEDLVVAYAERAGLPLSRQRLLEGFHIWRLRNQHDLVGGRTARDYVISLYPRYSAAAGG
ncbi:MAG: DUF815 domain-containing protein [Candidatus Latescibacterota bacterium]|nr:DUF815 domain-containing protein [Candidatus Latescibacterota bacterium]